MIDMFSGNRILITGGTGTLGQELARQLLVQNYAEIIIFSRSESAQVNMRRELPRLTYVIGDVRDKSAVKAVCKGVDVVYHLASLKHVGICEAQPEETIKTNVNGLQNIIDIHKGKLMFMSTDKAIDPTCVYGQTKAIGERLTLMAGGIVVRSGNIWASSGSVVPLFISQVKNRMPITLTNGDMTRLFISAPRLANFIIRVTGTMPSGVYIPDGLMAFRMRDIANKVVELYGDNSSQIIEVGALDGEKMHESTDGIHYSNDMLGTDEDLNRMFGIYPDL